MIDPCPFLLLFSMRKRLFQENFSEREFHTKRVCFILKECLIREESDQKNLLKCHWKIPFDLSLISFDLHLMPKGESRQLKRDAEDRHSAGSKAG